MASRDSGALEAFYDRYNRIAFTMVFRIVRVREDAEDILSDVFWQAWQQANRYDTSRGKPIAWLLTIARTRAIDYLRSGRKRGTETEFDSSSPPQPADGPGEPAVRCFKDGHAALSGMGINAALVLSTKEQDR